MNAKYNETFSNEANDEFFAKAVNYIEPIRNEPGKTLEKNAILEEVSRNLSEDLHTFIERKSREDKLRGVAQVFKTESEKLAYWERHIAGFLFEKFTQTEYHKKAEPSHLKTGEEPTEIEPIDEIALSEMIIEIGKHPDEYGLLKKIGNRLPDDIYTKFNKARNLREVYRIGEAKLSEKLDERAQTQLSDEGSRKTIKLLINELNHVLESGDFSGERHRLLPLQKLLGNTRLAVAENIGIDIVVPSNREIPDTQVLRGETESDDIALKRNENRVTHFLENNVPNAKLLKNIKEGTIDIVKSSFSSVEINHFTNIVMSTLEFNLELPGTVGSKHEATTANNETLATPQERVTKIVTEVEDTNKYLKWLYEYLNIGRNVDFNNDQHHKKKLSKVTFEDTQAIHETTGITIQIQRSEKGQERTLLKQAVQQHLDDWYAVLAELDAEHADTIGNGKRLTEEQKNMVDSLVRKIKQ